jgi:hypothetical protein
LWHEGESALARLGILAVGMVFSGAVVASPSMAEPLEGWMTDFAKRATAQTTVSGDRVDGHAAVFEVEPMSHAVQELMDLTRFADTQAGFTADDLNMRDDRPVFSFGYTLVPPGNDGGQAAFRQRIFYLPVIENGRVCRISIRSTFNYYGVLKELQNWCEAQIGAPTLVEPSPAPPPPPPKRN